MEYELIHLFFDNGTESIYHCCQLLNSLSNFVIGSVQDNKLEFIPKERVKDYILLPKKLLEV